MASERTVLVAGAGGLVGRAVIEHYLARGNVDVIALSRHPPIPHTGARFIAVDLTDAAGCAARTQAAPQPAPQAPRRRIRQPRRAHQPPGDESALVQETHEKIRPYSNATRGNSDIALAVEGA